VVGNKVQTPQDAAFLGENVGADLLAWFGHEPAVRAMDQGRPLALADLGPATRTSLGVLQDALDRQVKDWERYARQAAQFHLKNARRAAPAACAELAAQVDPGFTLAPYAVPAPAS
jgi:CO dehydrogenase maturation factor